MFFITNLIGIGILAVSFILTLVINLVLSALDKDGSSRSGVVILVFFGSAAVLDLCYRLFSRRDPDENRLGSPKMGGHIFFFPLWVCGLIAALIMTGQRAGWILK